jgi:hypothetical protein
MYANKNKSVLRGCLPSANCELQFIRMESSLSVQAEAFKNVGATEVP